MGYYKKIQLNGGVLVYDPLRTYYVRNINTSIHRRDEEKIDLQTYSSNTSAIIIDTISKEPIKVKFGSFVHKFHGLVEAQCITAKIMGINAEESNKPIHLLLQEYIVEHLQKEETVTKQHIENTVKSLLFNKGYKVISIKLHNLLR